LSESESITIIDEVAKKVFAAEPQVAEEGCDGCLHPRKDPKPEQLSIWLHSLKYEGDNWDYKTCYPDWAKDDFHGDSDLEERFWNYGGLWDNCASGEVI
jgi:hypothetical protein